MVFMGLSSLQKSWRSKKMGEIYFTLSHSHRLHTHTYTETFASLCVNAHLLSLLALSRRGVITAGANVL